MNTLLPWCFLFPVLTFALGALGLPKRAGLVSWLSPLSVFTATAIWLASGHETARVVFDGWVPFLPDSAFRLLVDPLAGAMLLVVGGVATCVYIYALGYMKEDPRGHRFFMFLDLFVAAMCLLVVAGNLTVLLLGWAGVGVASFLLISFWWQKGSPLQAGYLALGANAIGDAALLLAAVLVPKGAGELTSLHTAMENGSSNASIAMIGGLIVVAACAKSAQGPLWWWLPSAMAGPTPVSALIHAATMVAAGVYLLVRTFPLLSMSEMVMWNIALVGTLTAVLGGIASLWQSNFKRGLAYSTVSQLGWMFAAVGVGAPFAAFFHLVTHASFKAMLFLSAGTVIAATHHEEEITKLGGLRKHLPVTFGYFVLGTLALIGTPLVTSGSFSKDAILEGALHGHHVWAPAIGYVLLGSVVLTGAYAGRLLFGVFLGSEGESSKHAHGPGQLFLLPLVPLALGAIGLGYIEAGSGLFSSFLAPAVSNEEAVHVAPTLLGLGAFALGLVGVGLGALIARTKNKAIPAPPSFIADAFSTEAKVLPEGVSALHSGRVGRYALLSLLGAAALLAMSQRGFSGASTSSAPAAPSGSRPAPAAGSRGMGRPFQPRLGQPVQRMDDARARPSTTGEQP